MRLSIFQALLAIFTLISTSTSWAHELSGKKLLLKYEDEQYYTLDFSELGKFETDAYQYKNIAPKIYLVNWTEADGTFVDIVINLESMKVYSSGKSGEFKWFREGRVIAQP